MADVLQGLFGQGGVIREWKCVCVCVCVREIDRERGRETERERERKLRSPWLKY